MQVVANDDKVLVAFCESNGYSCSAVTQEDERAVWLKLAIKLRSDEKSADYFSSPPGRSAFAYANVFKIQSKLPCASLAKYFLNVQKAIPNVAERQWQSTLHWLRVYWQYSHREQQTSITLSFDLFFHIWSFFMDAIILFWLSKMFASLPWRDFCHIFTDFLCSRHGLPWCSADLSLGNSMFDISVTSGKRCLGKCSQKKVYRKIAIRAITAQQPFCEILLPGKTLWVGCLTNVWQETVPYDNVNSGAKWGIKVLPTAWSNF